MKLRYEAKQYKTLRKNNCRIRYRMRTHDMDLPNMSMIQDELQSNARSKKSISRVAYYIDPLSGY